MSEQEKAEAYQRAEIEYLRTKTEYESTDKYKRTQRIMFSGICLAYVLAVVVVVVLALVFDKYIYALLTQ